MNIDANKTPNNSYIEDDLDFKALIEIILNGKWIILSIASFFSILGVMYSLYLPDIYRSAALLNPVDIEAGSSNNINSSIANLAGIRLPTAGARKATEAIGKLKSYSFYESNILPNIFLPDLMAIKSWDSSSNQIEYDDSKYSKELKKWIKEPSAQASYKTFKKNLQVIEDQTTGFVTVAFKHQSPYIAKTYTELVVNEVNDFFRIKDQAEAQAAFNYLNLRLAQTSFAEIKLVIAQLLQQKTQTLTLIEVSDFYVFEYIDPPIIMEYKHEPSRALICIVFALIGGSLGLFFVLVRFFYTSSKL